MEYKDHVHANGPTYACPLCRFNGPTRNIVWDKHVRREHAVQIAKYRLKREDVTTVSQRPSVTGSSARSRPVVSNNRRSSSAESRETEGSIGPDPDFSISAPDNTEAYDAGSTCSMGRPEVWCGNSIFRGSMRLRLRKTG